MGRKDPGDALPASNARIMQLHSEMKDRGLVHDQSEERKRKRRKERRRTTEIKNEELKKSTDTLSRDGLKSENTFLNLDNLIIIPENASA